MHKNLEIGLIGNPCAGSLSPMLHGIFAKSLGITLQYHLWETGEDNLSSLMLSPSVSSVKGINVTIPYKGKIISDLVAISPLSRAIGAVNTLIQTEKGYYGTNTDVYGFEQVLSNHHINVSGRECLLVGAGGAAKAVAYALAENGARVFVWNRNEERGLAFATQMNGLFPDQFYFCTSDDLVDRFFAILVNTIPLNKEYDNLLLFERLNASVWMDVNYSLDETALGLRAKERNFAYMDGKEMLFYQGLRSFEIWNEYSFSENEKQILLERFFRKIKKKIVLIGFMGVGKSLCAQNLHNLAGFPVKSLDLALEEKFHRSIADIFTSYGENYFREMESQELEHFLSEEGPCVLDLGGGASLAFENQEKILGSDSFVVLLETDPHTNLNRLKDNNNRPLLKNKSESEIISLWEERRALYRRIAHIVVEASGNPIQIAKEIMSKWSIF